MIQTGVEQRLGRKAFFLLLARKATIASIFIAVSLVLLVLSGSIVKELAILLSLGGQSGASAASSVSSLVSFVVSGCFLIGLFLLLVGFAASWIQYRNFTFDFGEFDLHLSRGIIDRRETSIPYRQIQDVNIQRNFDHLLMGLAKIVMTTAGHEENGEKGMSEIVLDPLDKGVAEEIRNLLERKVGVQVVVDESVADRQAGVAAADSPIIPPPNPATS